jgi:GNAT superfamily N-acetyltransferase
MTHEASPRIRAARASDLQAIVALLADDPLGSGREKTGDPLPDGYRQAFEEIQKSPSEHLLVAEAAGRVVGCLQLSFLPSLTFGGRRRAQVEGVRIAPEHRGEGIGRLMIGAVKDMARAAGCHIIQLTTNRQRPQALRFYEKLGFVDSHHGLKLYLQD